MVFHEEGVDFLLINTHKLSYSHCEKYPTYDLYSFEGHDFGTKANGR